MEIQALKDTAINWEIIPEQKANGVTGSVISRTIEFQNFKIRQLYFSEDYEADHWCEKGHIIHVVSGELIIEYNEGPSIAISKGNSLVLGDHISSHKARTKTETQVLIID
ncbi:quercetin dioxygenase-like cupin family protein [Chryseobacterium defluvii]|uniref:Quercetin dioxygenase-like cupin family protein n=1 Tax=Chryseobacterium defluvii TaxID=160396 RepID=A0A840KJP2_9FLAO|nr:DHCW motif cupin fold protein [Chryseobacterium defluvii]MBB4807730.1 quercetin dioxygenase-like cupin family protein [Chryseobacterium defluvii]